MVDDFLPKIKMKNEKTAESDILFGAIWIFGGIMATAVDAGHVFWGAIVYGTIRMFRGILANPDQ